MEFHAIFEPDLLIFYSVIYKIFFLSVSDTFNNYQITKPLPVSRSDIDDILNT